MGRGASSAAAEPVDPVDRVCKLYRRIADLDRDPGSGHRIRNALSDELFALLPEVLASPEQFGRLVAISVSDADPLVRRMAAMDTDPMPPPVGPELASWLAHPSVGLARLQGEWRPALALMEVDVDVDSFDAAASYEMHYDSSWVGGPPLGPLDQWPRRADGVALVHVAQVDLRPLDAARGEDRIDWDIGADLPGTGVLQVFHDLETPVDEDRGAWLVRWVEQPAGITPVPDDARGPTPGHAMVGQDPIATLPPPDDLPHELRDGATTARQKLLASARLLQDPTLEELDALKPPSRLLGHGWQSTREACRLLDAAATSPLRPGAPDEWLLLLDIVGVGALDQWFGDEGHLEIWLRRADLVELRFDRAWALLR